MRPLIRIALPLLIPALMLVGSAAQAASQSHRPNIVVLFADDLGWSDVSYQGGDVPTPHIDRLAAQGVRFSAAYVPTATCSPSRAALLTGRHPARLGLTRHIPSHGFDKGRPDKAFNQWDTDPTQSPSRNWLPLEQRTYAELLQKRGYRTCFIGKWHLGHEPYYPIHQGFDEQHGVTPAGHTGSYTAPFFDFGDAYSDVPEGTYLTGKVTDDAVSFIENQPGDRPYHLSLFYFTVHSPLEGTASLVKKFRERGLSKKKANYAAMLTAMDRSVGRIHKAIQSRDDAANTLILFAGDQGGRFANKPFRGGKLEDTTYEGGSRVPFLITWPAEVAGGRTIDKPVMSIDFMPTIADLLGFKREKLAPLDGISLANVLLHDAPVPDRTVHLYRTYTDHDQALRDGRWKLIRYHKGEDRLYDLKNDPGEQHDLADQRPAQLHVLQQQLKAWKALMGVPRKQPPAPKRAPQSKE